MEEIVDGIRYARLTKDRALEAIACICDSFLRDEPITSHLRIGIDEFEPFATDLVEHCAKGGLSWVAIDEKTNVLAGVRVVADLRNDFVAQESYGNKMDLVFKFLETVATPLKSGFGFNGEGILHSHMVAVYEDYRGRGIARELLKVTSNYAYAKGYRTAIGEVTNRHNYSLLSKVKSFQPLNLVRYADFRVGKSRPFKGISFHQGCVLFKLDLSAVREASRDQSV